MVRWFKRKREIKKLEDIIKKREEVHQKYLEADRKGLPDADYYRGAYGFANWLLDIKD